MGYEEDYAGLADSGFEGGKEQVKPEDEFFHSLYISGKLRKNHLLIDEQPGKLQIRGVKYNLDEVHMIITNVKKVLVKEEKKDGRDTTTCFSFKQGNSPYKGNSGNTCGLNSAERASSTFCSICKEQIIVSGILSSKEGKPELSPENKPIFVFLRAKGMKYSNIGNYLSDLVKLDLSPIITPATEESKKFEKIAVNNKRFVTSIKVGTANSKHGIQQVFDLTKGNQLSDNDVKKILEIAKKTVEKFNEKFDWSKRSNSTSTGYAPQALAENQFESKKSEETTKKENSNFSFDDIQF